MIRLRRTVRIEPVDAHRLVTIVPPLLQGFRDLKFTDDGRAETADGRMLEGLQVTGGVHPRPGTSYSLVTRFELRTPAEADGGLEYVKQVDPAEHAPGWQRIRITSGPVLTTYTAYAAELVADDANAFQVRGQKYGESVELLWTLSDPRRPERLDIELAGRFDEAWPMGGPVSGSATVALNRFPPAGQGEPQVMATFQHRTVAGQLLVTLAPGPDRQWLMTIDVRIRPRGILLLVAPFTWFIRPKLQRAFDKLPLTRSWDELAQEIQAYLTANPDPARLAAAITTDLLAELPETLPEP